MRKAIFIIFIFISLIALMIRFGLKPLTHYLNLEPKAGIRVESTPNSEVFINGQSFGKTPFQKEDFTSGEYLVEVKNDKNNWKGFVKLNPGTLSVVNRELAETQTASSGEVINLEKGRGVTVISSPSGADVEIDGKFKGKTPILITEITEGEHQFIVSHANFLKRSIRALLTKDYNLNLKVDLAISSVDFTKIQTEPIESSPKVKVLQTPLGFLRVRSEPSLNSAEVARVKPGEDLIVLEEIPSWFKVRLSDGQEGYVSSSYVAKSGS